jgi:hypothetical protein
VKCITEFEIVGTFAGSFGIILEKQSSNAHLSSNDTEVNGVLSQLFTVLETVDNSDQLLSAITPFGKRTVSHYKQWLDDLHECNVNLELNWKNDSAATRRIHLIKENAPNIISTLNTIDTIANEDAVLIGILNGVNIRNHSFEISVDGHGLVKGHALPETLITISDKIGKEISANMIKSISCTKSGIKKTSWYMSSAN